ncbi:hypothetical protein [Spirillospora sp. NPDC047279]|uniref:hypothetical protein n=1 Tax=Spirillospora sp. NPDC047279 TaxID=3155478 RepID=UPI0033D22A2F
MADITAKLLSPTAVSELGIEISANLQKGVESVNKIIHEGNKFLEKAPDWLDWVIETHIKAFENLRDVVEKIVKKVNEILEGLAFPIMAFLLADDWIDLIKNPINKVIGSISDDNSKIDQFWQGPAAFAYKAAVMGAPNGQAGQTTALSEVATIAEDIKERLWALAGIVGGFYVALGVLVQQWLAAMTASAAAATTGAGAPPAAAAAGASSGVTFTAIIGLIAALGALISKQTQMLTDYDGKISANPAFPEGRWPRATVASMSDGSMKDKDGSSDWRLRT